jgi:hypothetical protein
MMMLANWRTLAFSTRTNLVHRRKIQQDTSQIHVQLEHLQGKMRAIEMVTNGEVDVQGLRTAFQVQSAKIAENRYKRMQPPAPPTQQKTRPRRAVRTAPREKWEDVVRNDMPKSPAASPPPGNKVGLPFCLFRG